MTNRRFERYHYRQILVRMRQGDSDREIARSNTMGRKKIAQVREVAAARGWLAPDLPLPDEATLSAQFARHEALPASCISTLEPWRKQITQWHAQGIQGTTIHDPTVQRTYAEYAEGYGFRIDPCPPRDPQKKGLNSYCTSCSA